MLQHTIDRDCTSHRIVDVGDRDGVRAGDRLGSTEAIGVGDLNRDEGADMRLGECQCCTGFPSNGHTIGHPLVGEGTQAVEISKS